MAEPPGGIKGKPSAKMTMDEMRNLMNVRVGFARRPATIRKVPRSRMKAGHINRMFDCDVEYLIEEGTGDVLAPEIWATRCAAPPVLYLIHERLWIEPEPDALEEFEYVGNVIVVIDNVPTAVTKDMLNTWLSAGLDEHTEGLVPARHKLAQLQEQYEITTTAIDNLVHAGGEEWDGEAIEKKRDKARRLNYTLKLTTAQLARTEAQLAALMEKRATDAAHGTLYTLSKSESDRKRGTATWEAVFADDKQARKVAFWAVHKYDWRDYRLGLDTATGDILVTKMIWKEDVDMETLKEFNMRGVTVSRVRHGQGMYRFEDERGLYSGNWRRNLRHGKGESVSIAGRFQGTFDKDWRRGEGVQFYANGDVYRGSFNAHGHHPRQSYIYGDEYMDGHPHGDGKMSFVDGSEYVGTFAEGAITGYGSHTTPHGQIQRGVFHRLGFLHGPGMEVMEDGHVRSGEFRFGGLHGSGVEQHKAGMYKGHFKDGEKDGYGEQQLPAMVGEYKGWFQQGLRHGRGVMAYARDIPIEPTSGEALFDETMRPKPPTPRKPKDSKLPPVAGRSSTLESSHRGKSSAKFLKSLLAGHSTDVYCQGPWVGGALGSGAIITKRQHHIETRKQHSYPGQFDTPQFPDLRALPGKEFHAFMAEQQEYVDRSAVLLDRRLTMESEYMVKYRRWGKHASKSLRRAQRLRYTVDEELGEFSKLIGKPARLLLGEDTVGGNVVQRALMEKEAADAEQAAVAAEAAQRQAKVAAQQVEASMVAATAAEDTVGYYTADIPPAAV